MTARTQERTAPHPVPPTDSRVLLTLLLAGFAVLRAVSVATHEMWRDELQAWGVATQTDGLAELAGALRSEGHPPLWYLVLRGVGYVWPDPVAMQILTWVIGVAVAAVVLRCAPAPLWVRCAVLLGYHLGYEYAALSRSYNLGVLLAVGALAALTAQRPRRSLAAVLLVGLALTSAFGAALALAFGAAMILDARRGAGSDRTRVRATAAATVAGLVLVSVPAVDVLFGGNPGLRPASGTADRVHSASRGLMAVFPLPDWPHPAWGSTLGDPMSGRLALALLLVVVVAVAWSVRADPPAVALWLSAVVLVELITMIAGVQDLRHLGHLHLALLGALWFTRRPGAPRRRVGAHRVDGARRTSSELIGAAVVAVGLVAGLTSIMTDVRGLFSPTESMASYLSDALPPDAQVLADTDFGTSGVAIALDRRFHFPATDAEGTYARWTARTCGVLVANGGGCFPHEEVLSDAERLAATGDGPVWLLLTYPLDDPRLEPVHSVVGGEVTGENQYAYRLIPTG